MLQNSIGPYRFLELRGVPDFIGERMEAIQRPGVDGTTFRKLGKHGIPFACVSRVDCLTMQSAGALVTLYKGMLGIGPQELIRAGIPQSIYGVAVVTLEIKPIVTRAIGVCSGGLNGVLSRAWLECIWQLMPVEVSGEE